jgi:hypothetical protein
VIRVAIFHVIGEASGASGDILVQRVGRVIAVDVAMAPDGGGVAVKALASELLQRKAYSPRMCFAMW